MPITQTTPKYQTSDGREWTTQDEAERHEMLMAARAEYDRARAVFNRALARTQVTADGHPFDFDWRRYYYVTRRYGDMPALQEVTFYGYNFELRERDDELELLERVHRDGRDWTNEFRFSALYRHRARAEAALLAAQEKWLAERTAEVDELRAKVAPAQRLSGQGPLPS